MDDQLPIKAIAIQACRIADHAARAGFFEALDKAGFDWKTQNLAGLKKIEEGLWAGDCPEPKSMAEELMESSKRGALALACSRGLDPNLPACRVSRGAFACPAVAAVMGAKASFVSDLAEAGADFSVSPPQRLWGDWLPAGKQGLLSFSGKFADQGTLKALLGAKSWDAAEALDAASLAANVSSDARSEHWKPVWAYMFVLAKRFPQIASENWPRLKEASAGRWGMRIESPVWNLPDAMFRSLRSGCLECLQMQKFLSQTQKAQVAQRWIGGLPQKQIVARSSMLDEAADMVAGAGLDESVRSALLDGLLAKADGMSGIEAQTAELFAALAKGLGSGAAPEKLFRRQHGLATACARKLPQATAKTSGLYRKAAARWCEALSGLGQGAAEQAAAAIEACGGLGREGRWNKGMRELLEESRKRMESLGADAKAWEEFYASLACGHALSSPVRSERDSDEGEFMDAAGWIAAGSSLAPGAFSQLVENMAKARDWRRAAGAQLERGALGSSATAPGAAGKSSNAL